MRAAAAAEEASETPLGSAATARPAASRRPHPTKKDWSETGFVRDAEALELQADTRKERQLVMKRIRARERNAERKQAKLLQQQQKPNSPLPSSSADAPLVDASLTDHSLGSAGFTSQQIDSTRESNSIPPATSLDDTVKLLQPVKTSSPPRSPATLLPPLLPPLRLDSPHMSPTYSDLRDPENPYWVSA